MLMTIATSPLYQLVCLFSAVTGLVVYGIYRLWLWLWGTID